MKIAYANAIKLSLLTFIFGLHAQEPSYVFTQAHKLYQQNECATALKLFDQIPHKSAAVWYNMGNCAYKLNDQINALLYWKRAYKYGNAHIKKDSLTNMSLISIPHTTYEHPYEKIDPLTMQILFFCIFGIFLIVAYFLIHAKRWIFLAMSFSVLVSAGRITQQVYVASQRALIMQDESILRAGPGTEYHQIRTIPWGTTVKLLKQAGDWSQIEVEGNRGWIENKQMERI